MMIDIECFKKEFELKHHDSLLKDSNGFDFKKDYKYNFEKIKLVKEMIVNGLVNDNYILIVNHLLKTYDLIETSSYSKISKVDANETLNALYMLYENITNLDDVSNNIVMDDGLYIAIYDTLIKLSFNHSVPEDKKNDFKINLNCINNVNEIISDILKDPDYFPEVIMEVKEQLNISLESLYIKKRDLLKVNDAENVNEEKWSNEKHLFIKKILNEYDKFKEGTIQYYSLFNMIDSLIKGSLLESEERYHKYDEEHQVKLSRFNEINKNVVSKLVNKEYLNTLNHVVDLCDIYSGISCYMSGVIIENATLEVLESFSKKILELDKLNSDKDDLIIYNELFIQSLNYEFNPAKDYNFNFINYATNVNSLAEKILDDPIFFIEVIKGSKDICEKQSYVLSHKKKSALRSDEYGFVDVKKWDKEKDTFTRRLLSLNYDLSDGGVVFYSLYSLIYNVIIEKVLVGFESSNEVNKKPDYSNHQKGINYENECIDILKDSGWKVIDTPKTGDKGVDILAFKHGINIAFQCKNWASKIGSSSIQEIYTGMDIYNANFGVVLSESGFTTQANEMANDLNIILISKEDLNKIEFIILNSKK